MYVLFVSLLAGSLAASQTTGKSIGFSLQVGADGSFNPKVTKAVVKSVESGSQAQAAGLSVGDELVRVEGVHVRNRPTKAVIDGAHGQMSTRWRNKPNATRQD